MFFKSIKSVSSFRIITPFVIKNRRFISASTETHCFLHSYQQIPRHHLATWPSQFVFNKNIFNCRSTLKWYCSIPASSISSSEDKVSSTPKPEVFVQGDDVPDSCDSFDDLGLKENVLLELARLGFQRPTTIQSHCMPVTLTGRDMVGIGQTGSGKTLAYVLPALIHLSKEPSSLERNRKPRVLVLAPTRELAQQIEGVVRSFQNIFRFKSVCLYGGVSKGPQINCLENGVDICIATPGRLIDLLETMVTDLSQIAYLVVDEADRMLDMGFEPQVRKIIRRIHSLHQTLMWSATWPSDVKNLAKDFLKNPVQVTVGSTELMANPNINQNIHICEQHEKEKRLFGLLERILSEKENKVLIFAETKRSVDRLTNTLSWNKYPTSSVHGDKSQLQRDNALHDFRSNRSSVLIATDVAARGLDITDITHVVNYDFPKVIETYVHRIGRTARAEKTGTAHSFFTPEDGNLSKELVNVLMKCNQDVDPELLDLCQRPTMPPKNLFNKWERRSKNSFFNQTSHSVKSYPRSPRSSRYEGYEKKSYNDRDDD